MSKQSDRLVRKFALIFIILLALFTFVFVRIIAIQYFERDTWLQIADIQKKERIIKPQRGNIYDINGALLATTLPRYNVFMDAAVKPLHQGGDTLFNRHISNLSFQLSRIIGDKSPDAYRKVISVAFKRNKRNQRLNDRTISETQKKQIEQIDLIKRGKNVSGITFERKEYRKNPYENLARRTIGNIDNETGRGLYGLELYFNNYLQGSAGKGTRKRVGKRREDVVDEYPIDGADIITTLDVTLQDIVESELRKRLVRTQAQWGCCILMETETGAIRAIANLDKTSNGVYQEKLNHAVIRVEPGSTFKTIALLAALETHNISINDKVKVTKKAWNYRGILHTDAHPKDTTFTIRNAFACSSNIALAKIITKTFDGNAQKLINKVSDLGILDSFLITIPGAQMPLMMQPNDSVTISKMAYGYSVELSPLHLVVFYNAIANGGKMISPVFVSQINYPKNKTIRLHSHTIKSSICDEKSLSDIKQCLHDVVWDNRLGTASVSQWGFRLAQSPLIPIAGKTGTVQLLENGRYRRDQHRLCFVGYFPEDDPKYTCLCMINHPKNRGAYDAGLDCGTAVRIIAEKVMAYKHHYKQENGKIIID